MQTRIWWAAMNLWMEVKKKCETLMGTLPQKGCGFSKGCRNNKNSGLEEVSML